MAKLELKTRYKIIENEKARYRKSNKKTKGVILDGICMATDLSRSRIKHLINEKARSAPPAQSRSGRNPKYGQVVREALEKVWVLMDFASGKRLCAGMDDIIDSITRHGECEFEENTQTLLLEMSPSTADRILSKAKEHMRFKGLSATKPGTLLKRDIPIRLGTEWDEAVPGFVECDLVAHCGSTAAGEYINTLDVTDICSGWTETMAVINKAQKHVFEALRSIESNLPFPLLGIDSDNGSEFINHELYRYCKEHHISFTRSRPYMKNDSCHVEQKNWHIVRRNIGYGRYEGKEAVSVLNKYYSLLRLYSNFFSPQTKLVEKCRDGARVKKRYETPSTPYRRLLSDENISPAQKARLTETFLSLNPAALKRDMMKLLDKLLKLMVSS